MIARALLSAVAAGAALYLVRLGTSYDRSVDDRIALVFGAKLLIVHVLGLHYLLTGRQSRPGWFERFVAFAERRPVAVVAASIVVTMAIAFATTPQIEFGEGRLGTGYGSDGAIYGAMTEQFAKRDQPIVGQWGYRFLPAMLVHYSGLDTFTGFRLLNLTSHALATVLLYRIAGALGLGRFAAVLAVFFFTTLKFGLKFLVYYPVNTDGVGELLLMAILWATLEKRHLAYVLAMLAAVGSRENLLALMPFHALYVLRSGSDSRRFAAALLPQLPVLAGYWLSRTYPVFPVISMGTADAVRMTAGYFVQSAALQQKLLLAYVNAVGVPLILLGLAWRRALAVLGARYEWAYLVAASVALSAVGGTDLDRFATWLAPVAILGALGLHVRRGACVPRVWAYWVLIQAAAMEFFLPWFPEKTFYVSRYAASTTGAAFAYVAVFSWALVATVVAVHWSATASAAAAAQSGVNPADSSTIR